MKHLAVNIAFGILLVGWAVQGLPWYWLLPLFAVHGGILFLGSYFIQLNFFVKAHCKGVETDKAVALTFDDGPDATFTPMLLDVLKKHKAKATFFLIGKNIAGNEGLVQRMVDEGHTVGNHSYNHAFWFDLYPAKRVLEELKQTDETIKKVIGKKPLLFRPPYGVTNPPIAKAVKRGSYEVIGWNVRSLDTMVKTEVELAQRVLPKCEKGNIFLFHDTSETTVKVIDQFLEKLTKDGLRAMTVDELLDIKAYEID